MKIKYLFMSIAAIAVLAAGCTKELPGNLEELQVSKSYVSIPEAGGSEEVKITAKGNWTIVADAKSTWLEISPKNGGAGETVVKFSAKNTLNTNQTTVNIKIGDKIQYINVKQQVGSGDPDVITCSQVKDQPDGKEVMLKGMCTKITESQQYGNWYIKDDTGEVLIYGTKDWAKKGIEVGDVVLVQGPKKDYKGTIELVDVKVLKIIKSIIKLDKDMVELDKEAADFTVKASFKGEVMEPVISADWLTLVGASAAEGSITYKFHATDHNVIEAPRNAEITFTAKKKTKDAEGNEEVQTSVVVTSVVQQGNEPALSTIAAAIATSGADVHIEGQVVANCAQGYVLADDSGVVFVYSKKFNSKIKIGEKRKAVGKMGAYHYGAQIGTLYFDEWMSKGSYTYPTPVVLNAVKMNEKVAALTGDGKTVEISAEYVKAAGTVKVSGSYINVLVEGESALKISLYAVTDKQKTSLTALDGKKVDIYGYLTSIYKKKSFNIVLTKFEEIK